MLFLLFFAERTQATINIYKKLMIIYIKSVSNIMANLIYSLSKLFVTDFQSIQGNGNIS